MDQVPKVTSTFHILLTPILEHAHAGFKAYIDVHANTEQRTSTPKPFEHGLGVGALQGVSGA